MRKELLSRIMIGKASFLHSETIQSYYKLTYHEQTSLNHLCLYYSCMMALTGNAEVTSTIFRLIIQSTSRAPDFRWHDYFMDSGTSEVELEGNVKVAAVSKY